jgi:arylsulfatase A-like enzyme
LLDKTIVVVLSDHGEAFGERGFEGHARSVFPETTETPLIISLPFSLTPGIVVTDRTNNIDVWPTLLSLIGLPDQGEIDGRSRRNEILAAARGELSPSSEGEYSFSFLDENWGKPETKRRAAVSVVDGEYRYVAGSDVAGRDFEVLLSTEDGEQSDRIEAQPEIGERLRAEAERYLESMAAFDADVIDLDEMQLDQLRALGYQLH